MTLLTVRDLAKTYHIRSGRTDTVLHAVRDVSFDIEEGECLGLIGESGSGKSTVSRMVCGLLAPSAGSVALGGRILTDMTPRRFARTPARADVQIVFQDPDTSLNPAFTVYRCVADPVRRLQRLPEAAVKDRVRETMALVGLSDDFLDRRPHQLSGGQKARVGIARAVATMPKLLVLDEPTAALDVSVQAVIMQLLDDLRKRLRMSYLFISHDLDIVRLISDRIAVMKAGEIVEMGDRDEILRNPRHAYTRSLLASSVRRQRAVAPGTYENSASAASTSR